MHPQWATACFFGLSCLFHLGNALLWRKPYLRLLASGYAQSSNPSLSPSPAPLDLALTPTPNP
jgi:hypothetical protein